MSDTAIRFYCKDLTSNKYPTIIESSSSVSLIHHSGDPPSVNRILASVNGFEVELLPSKGFSVGQVYLNDRIMKNINLPVINLLINSLCRIHAH